MSHLKNNYTIKEMSYLDSPEASLIYKLKANLIKKHNLKGIVDIGCRTGEVNNYLKNYNYFYYGFDTSAEPIDLARQNFPNQIFEVRSWNSLRRPKFNVDVVIFGSVLIYDDAPLDMFERICSFYNPKRAIVHEVNTKNTEQLKYTDLDYFHKYKNDSYEIELDIPVKHRTIIDVQYR